MKTHHLKSESDNNIVRNQRAHSFAVGSARENESESEKNIIKKGESDNKKKTDLTLLPLAVLVVSGSGKEWIGPIGGGNSSSLS